MISSGEYRFPDIAQLNNKLRQASGRNEGQAINQLRYMVRLKTVSSMASLGECRSTGALAASPDCSSWCPAILN